MRYLLKTGYARVDITPEKYHGLAGFGTDEKRVCDNILDRPMATCVAISDEKDQTYLLISSDTLYVSEQMTDLVRQEITVQTGIPRDHVLIVATHTHAGPSVFFGSYNTEAFYPFYVRQLTKAAKEALEDLDASEVFVGRKEVANMTFVRHYLLDDGTFIGMGYGYNDRKKLHLSQSDEQMQIIRFGRKNTRDILLVNWQSHATITSGDMRKDMSADYIAAFRDHLEGLSGCKVVFFQGACGNLVPSSRISEENIVAHDHILYGRHLAEAANSLLSELQPVKSGPVRSRQLCHKAMVDRSDFHLAEIAGKVYDAYYATDDPAERRQILKNNGFNSVYHAMHVRGRAKLPDTIAMEINSLCIGDIAFSSVPYEMFCSNGKYIKDNSPVAMTFILGYCNGFNSYLPDAQAFDYDCYEVNARRFPKGSAEEIAQIHVDLLHDLCKE